MCGFFYFKLVKLYIGIFIINFNLIIKDKMLKIYIVIFKEKKILNIYILIFN